MTAWPSTISFAGYSWAVKSSSEPVGPGPNLFSDSPHNVWVDAEGQMHLRITQREGRWQCAEVALDRSLGYGTYSFTVASPVGELDRSVVLGLFTWSDESEDHHREIDVEFARWRVAPGEANALYAVQPDDREWFCQPRSAPTVHSFTWARASVAFESTAIDQTIASWRTSGAAVPRAGGEQAHINLWLNRGMPPTSGAEVEVVLSDFCFARHGGSPPAAGGTIG